MATERASPSRNDVLKKYPHAYAARVGLALRFVIASRKGYGCKLLSGIRARERDSWADAARRIYG